MSVWGIPLPLAKRWSSFDENHIDREGDAYGCYELGDGDREIVYIGQGRVRQRLMAHWRDAKNKPGISYYRCAYSGSKKRAVQMERVELQQYDYLHGELPLYNGIGWLNP